MRTTSDEQRKGPTNIMQKSVKGVVVAVENGHSGASDAGGRRHGANVVAEARL